MTAATLVPPDLMHALAAVHTLVHDAQVTGLPLPFNASAAEYRADVTFHAAADMRAWLDHYAPGAEVHEAENDDPGQRYGHLVWHGVEVRVAGWESVTEAAS